MKISKKMILGFAGVISMLVITGLFGWYGISSTISDMEDISQQLEITKDINRSLVNIGDAQASALRLIIYKDHKYMDSMNAEEVTCLDNAKKAAAKMKSQKNKDNVKILEKEVGKYTGATDKWWEIEKEKEEAGKRRSAAADEVLNSVKDIIGEELKHAEEEAGSNEGKISKKLLDKLMLLQELRNATNRFMITAQKYQLAITPEQQDEKQRYGWSK